MNLTVLALFGGFAGGLLLGTLVASWWWLKRQSQLTADLQAQKNEELERLTTQIRDQMRESFQAVSAETLSKTTEDFLKLAETRLKQQTENNAQTMDSKKTLIDQTLKNMNEELGKVQGLVQTFEKDRQAKFDVLQEQLGKTATETQRLAATASGLEAALTNSRVRGQWGERMADDVLRLAGLEEGLNYEKQQQLGQGESAANKPDFTFYLPRQRVVHMDVKFPLENYLHYMEAEDDLHREQHKKQFVRDTRNHVKAAASRGYAESGDTLDYVLVFIPNEQVYAFLHEHDRTLLDDAMRQKVILCSPMTLYAILAVIRQAVENFHMERRAGEILDLLAEFKTQWDKFRDQMDKVGKKIDESQNAFHALTTTRSHQLERRIQKIEMLTDTEQQAEGTQEPQETLLTRAS